jgi:putative transposase
MSEEVRHRLKNWATERAIHLCCNVVRWFPSTLHHTVPDWVEPGAIFHIRIALDRTKQQATLITSPLAESLMESAIFYHRKYRWHITAFLLMPDHIHALLSFARDKLMSRVSGDWKHFHAHKHGVIWQEGYFDHRLRDDERGEQLSAKINYIRQNPVVAGLRAKVEEWSWWIERPAIEEVSAREVGKK